MLKRNEPTGRLLADERLCVELRKWAISEGRSMRWTVNSALREYLAQHAERSVSTPTAPQGGQVAQGQPTDGQQLIAELDDLPVPQRDAQLRALLDLGSIAESDIEGYAEAHGGKVTHR